MAEGDGRRTAEGSLRGHRQRVRVAGHGPCYHAKAQSNDDGPWAGILSRPEVIHGVQVIPVIPSPTEDAIDLEFRFVLKTGAHTGLWRRLLLPCSLVVSTLSH